MIISGGPVLTSWDAWTATDDDHRHANGSSTGNGARNGNGAAPPPVRPAAWPTPDVLRLINQCRVAAGLASRGEPG
jgi:hypothetical protein